MYRSPLLTGSGISRERQSVFDQDVQAMSESLSGEQNTERADRTIRVNSFD